MNPAYYVLVTKEQMDVFGWDYLDVHRLANLKGFVGSHFNVVKYAIRLGQKPGEEAVDAAYKMLRSALETLEWQLQQSGITNVPIEVQEAIADSQRCIAEVTARHRARQGGMADPRDPRSA